MAMFGSKDVVALVDGYSLLAAKPQKVSYKIKPENERTDGIGDQWPEKSPTGMRGAELAQDGAFFDKATGSSYDALSSPASSPNAADRIVCLGDAGNVIGRPFSGFVGVVQAEFEALSEIGKLVRANAAFGVNGAIEDGVILHAHGNETANGNTQGTSVDNATQLQVAVPIVSNTQANPTVVTTSVPHKLVTGDTVVISGNTGSNAAINGLRTVTVLSSTTFSVPINCTTAGGTGGSFVRGKTSNGAAGYLQVEEVVLDGATSVTVVISDSDDNGVWATRITFTNVTARTAERIAIAVPVSEYLSVSWTFNGGGGANKRIKFFAGLARF